MDKWIKENQHSSNDLISMSISYHYKLNIIELALVTQSQHQLIANVGLDITLNSLTTGDEIKRINTNKQGRLSFNYNLSQLDSIKAEAQLRQSSGSIILVNQVMLVTHPPAQLTLSGYFDQQYLIIFGNLFPYREKPCLRDSVEISIYAESGDMLSLNCNTNHRGEYCTKISLPIGKWLVQTTMIGEGNTLIQSREIVVNRGKKVRRSEVC